MNTKNLTLAAALVSCALAAQAQSMEQVEAQGRSCFHSAAADMLGQIADQHWKDEQLGFAGGIAANPLGGMNSGFAGQLEQRNRAQAYRQQDAQQVWSFMVTSCGDGVLQAFGRLGMTQTDAVAKTRQMLNEKYSAAVRERR